MSEAGAGQAHVLELLTAAGCPRCDRVRATIRRVLADYPGLTYREVDVAEDLEAFMRLGVLSTPAIRIDGEVVFTSAPDEAALRRALTQRLPGAPEGGRA